MSYLMKRSVILKEVLLSSLRHGRTKDPCAEYNEIRFLFTSAIMLQKTGHGDLSSNNESNFCKVHRSPKTEINLVLKPADDPDVFGTLHNSNVTEPVGDEGDKEEETRLTYPPSSRLRIKQYADIIKGYLQQKKLGDAVDVLETRMIKQDRMKPDSYIYSLLIGACGRYGYTKKAFQLYNQMKKRALKVNNAVYTGLFNACANSPWREDGLKRALQLRQLMIEKRVECNDSNYHAMIKAFGHCGDLEKAFQIVDEMVDKEVTITDETFNFLLQACISDQEVGFRHAIVVWHKMLQRSIKPNIYTFNLLLRCARDCNLGEEIVVHKLINEIREKEKSLSQETINPFPFDAAKVVQPTEYPHFTAEVPQSDMLSVNSPEPNYPDLLSPVPRLGNIIALTNVTRPHDRLVLLGGLNGILENMKKYDVSPDIKTYSLLLDTIPPTVSAEKMLVSKMKKDGIYIDVDFYNMLIKKRSVRFDYEKAKDVLKLIRSDKLHPDIVTFGVLALGCKTAAEAKDLIQDMKQAGYRLNVEILGAMLKMACVKFNFKYAAKILYIAKDEEVKPSPEFLKHIDELLARCKNILRNERSSSLPPTVDMKIFKKELHIFKSRYEVWLEEIGGRENITHPHPWKQFHKSSSTQTMKLE